MADYPRMVFRDGSALPEHGVDWLIVECEAELANALADGWRVELHDRHPLDHDGDGVPGGSPAGENATRRRGRKPKA